MTTHLFSSTSPVVLSPICTLRDKSDEGTKSVPITVMADSDWLAIRPQGYGEAEAMDGHGDPVLLEVWNGELRLVVGTDINDPHKSVVSLEGAREELRRDRCTEETVRYLRTSEHREHPWRTVSVIAVGLGNAGALALQLLAHSLWFRCTPLPDDEYEFAIKAEHADWFQQR
jgi:hypothetical protein